MDKFKIKKGKFEIRVKFVDDLEDFGQGSFVKLTRKKIIYEMGIDVGIDNDLFKTIMHELTHFVQGVCQKYPNLNEKVAEFVEYVFDELRWRFSYDKVVL